MNRSIALPIILSMLLFNLMGCMTIDPYTGERKLASSTIASSAGAIGGAIIGAATTNKPKGALIGAGIGAALGGGVGLYMDKQARELRHSLRNTGVQVVRKGDMVQLIMPGDITFANNRAEIKSKFYPTLRSVAVVLAKYNRTLVEVDGYTSSTGSDAYNQVLSEKRSQSVASYLSSQGVNRNRLIARGYGKRYPVASNKTAIGQAKNRRVTISLRPRR